jgi:hypothetical protein
MPELRVEACIFAAELDVLFQIRPHGGEVVSRPRFGPSHIGSRAVRTRPLDIVGRQPDRLVEVPPRHPDQRGILGIVGQLLTIGCQLIDEPAQFRINGPLMGKSREQRRLAPPRLRSAGRHVGCLVPAQHRIGVVEVADFEQALLQRGELRFRRLTVAGDDGAGLGWLPCAAGQIFGGVGFRSLRHRHSSG